MCHTALRLVVAQHEMMRLGAHYMRAGLSPPWPEATECQALLVRLAQLMDGR